MLVFGTHTQTIGPYYDHIDKKDGQKHIDTDGLGPGSDWSMPDSERHPSDLTFSEVWLVWPAGGKRLEGWWWLNVVFKQLVYLKKSICEFFAL